MASGPRYRVPFRRRRENRTDYRSRKALVKSGLPRAVVRRSNRHIRVQIAEYVPDGDRILASAFSKELSALGWAGNCDNIPGAYLTGFMAGMRCLKAGIGEVVVDIGMHSSTKGCVIYAALKGMVDAGLTVPHDDSVLPSDDRIAGKHLPQSVQTKVNDIKEKLAKGGEEQ